MRKPVVYAHRGASGYEIENTIPSFELAVKMKADAVEFDVQLTSDGQVVVFHDFTLARLFNSETRVAELTAGEMKQQVFKDPVDGKPVFIPLLEEVLSVISHKIAMNIELKSDDGRQERIAELCGKVYDLIQKYGLRDDVIVSSFNLDALRQMRGISEDVRIGVLVDRLADDDQSVNAGDEGTLSFYIRTARELKAAAINMSYAAVDANRIQRIHDSGFSANIYTVNNEELMRMLMKEGVDGFFTNYPDTAIALIEGKRVDPNPV